MWRLAVVGNLALDVVDGRPPRPGGGPFHCARALRALGIPAVVATQCAAEHRAALVPPLVALGVPVAWRPAQATAAFTIRYSGEERSMTVDGLGDPWTPADARDWIARTVRRWGRPRGAAPVSRAGGKGSPAPRPRAGGGPRPPPPPPYSSASRC